MRPASFDMELSTAWSLWVLEHGLPDLPEHVADRTSVPVTWWRGPDSAAVLHLRRWSSDEEQEPCTEVDVEVFELVDGAWEPAAAGGAGGWAGTAIEPRQVAADHADLSGVVQGMAGGAEVVALWGEAGASAATAEVEQDGEVTTRPLVGELGWVVVSAVVRGPVVARIRDRSGRVLARGTARPWDQRPHVTVMADFGCFAWTDSRELRHARPRPGGDLDLSLLGVSRPLVADLEAWHAEWERAAYGQPPHPGDDADTWETRGRDAARRLQLELPGVEVQFRDGEGGRDVVDG